MLIRISGGNSGLGAYLQYGQKQDRDLTRDQLDERLIFSGDLDIFENLVRQVPTRSDTAERYNHITLSFKENFVSPKVMRDILDEFKTFISAAYQDDELYLYAEAHIPKIKSIINPKTGESVERLPHIHIAVPLVNMVSGRRLETFGFVPKSIKHIDAFQEYINTKYELASPKDSPRIEAVNQLDRLGGRDFLGRDHLDLKMSFAEKVMSGEIDNLNALAAELSKVGKVNIANPTKPLSEQYARLVNQGGQAIRFRSQMFREPFLSKTPEEKQAVIVASQQSTYTEKLDPVSDKYLMTEQGILDSQKEVPALQHWYEIRAKEIKHLNPNSRFLKGAYAEMTDNQKREALAQFDTKFDEKWRIDDSSIVDIGVELKLENQKQEVPESLEITSTEERVNYLQQICSMVEEGEIEIKAQKDELMAEIRKNLDPDLLLAALAESHGLQRENYRTRMHPKTGDPFILVGKRRFSVSDFLTKEVHLKWANAREILVSVYEKQKEGVKPAPLWIDKQKDLWTEFYESQFRPRLDANRQAMAVFSKKAKQARKDFTAQAKEKITPLRRQPAALSIAKMENVRDRAAMNLRFVRMRESFKLDAQHEFKDWLRKQAELGREDALKKLKAMSRFEQHKPEQDSIALPESDELEMHVIILQSIEYKVRVSGDVLYSLPDKSQFVDTGRRIAFEPPEKSDAAILVALNLAVEKFGTDLELSGSDAFKRKAKEIAQAE